MSIQLKLHYINSRVFEIAYESNPTRKGWELHKLDVNPSVKIKDDPKFHDCYYLLNCYENTLTENETNVLWGYADGLMQKCFFNWMNGRTSLSDKINTTMDDWEQKFDSDIKIIKGIFRKRLQFIRECS